MANCPALLCLAFQRYLLLVVCSWPMLRQLPCRWAHCLAEATVICSTEFASSFSLYGLWVFQLSRFFSRYRLPRCVLFACILTLAEWNAQHFNVVIHFPLKFVLSEFVHFFTEILHLKFIIKASNSLLRSTKIERDKLPPLQIALFFCLICWCVNFSHQLWGKVLLHPLDERLVLVRSTDLRDNIVDFSFERDLCMFSLR